MTEPPRHNSRRAHLLRIWLVSCAVSVAIAVGGKLYERWSTCSFQPGHNDCVLGLLYTKLYCYAAAFIIFIAMTAYVLLTARRAKRRSG